MKEEKVRRIEELEALLNETSAGDQRLELLLELMEQLEDQDYVRSWGLAEEAVTLARTANDRFGLAKALEGTGTSLWKLGEFSQALQRYEDALDLYLSVGDLHGAAGCYCGMGIIHGSLEEFSSALEYFEEALSAARRSGRDELAATITGNIGHVYFSFGQYNNAMECFEHAYDYKMETQHLVSAGDMLGGMAGVFVFQGEYEKGLEFLKRAIRLHRQCNHPRGVVVGTMNLGISNQRMGRFRKAEKLLIEALELSRNIKLRAVEVDICKVLNELYSEMGQSVRSSIYLKLYMDGKREQERQEVARKNEQFRKRQQISTRLY